MQCIISPTNTLQFESAVVALGRVLPVLNGQVLADWPARITPAAQNGVTAYFDAPGDGQPGFGLAIQPDKAGQLWLHYWLENLPPDEPLNSFGLCFAGLQNMRAFLRQGYYSWDGSFYVEPETLAQVDADDPPPETGYALTQLLPRSGSGSVVVGFTRHHRFQQTFTVNTDGAPFTLTVETLWDQKDRAGLPRCESEPLVIFEHPGVEEALRAWAQLVAAAAPVPPRLAGPPLTGWCSWYNLYAAITEENILHHLHRVADVAQRENLPMHVFQIDDGFTPEMGDWLDIKPQFPRGMKPLLDDIRAAGFTPGLWIAPFMVGNRSRLFARHPDWVVQDRATGQPLAQMRFYGEFRWHKRSEEYYILDTTHPAAFDYLRRVFRTWRRDWGCEYFKTDFMHFGAEHGPNRALWHTPGLSRIEIWRRAAEMIRAEIGPEAIWLGCGCPLWAAVGLVDGVRIGRDVGVEWAGSLATRSLLRDQTARNFTNHILWQIDPDCVLLRHRFHHLTQAEQRSLAIFAGMSGGAMLTSDDLAALSADRLRLWKLLLSGHRARCRFPLLGQTALSYERLPADLHTHRTRRQPRAADPVLVQVRLPAGDDGLIAVFSFNTGDQPRQRVYPLAVLGIEGPRHVFDWTANRAWPGPVDTLSVALPPHEGILLFLSLEPLMIAPEKLP